MSIVIILIFKITYIVNAIHCKQEELKERKSRCIVYVNIYLLVFFLK